MFVDVQKMCRACPDCQRSVRGLKPKAPLVPLPIIDIPFERIAMDIIGPLPRTKAGNRYILTLMDYGFRYPEAITIRQTDSKTIAQALIGLFSRVVIPWEILTDFGANLTGKLMSDLCRLMNIKQLKTSPYNPQTDGMLERFHATLKAMIRKMVHKFNGHWDQALPYVLFTYREVPCESTGFSPFELLYGRIVRGPLPLLTETWTEEGPPPTDVVTYV